MIIDVRNAIESPVTQGVNEKKPYRLKIPLSWGDMPSSPTCKITDSGGEDVTGEVCEAGNLVVSGRLIITPRIASLSNGERYTMSVLWNDDGGEVLEAKIVIVGAA